ncbi:FAD-binding oxidoreductase [Thauera sp. SDU_THAU2]|uniref:FAD-binding oxidoreductase n=1 Tax=Thauera sp. SDU_THAU2 TaxID=3136633 RepID=UPI00311E414C
MNGKLLSWGCYPDCPQLGHHPAWPDELAGLLEQAAAQAGSCLPYGNGRSYGDSCLAESGHVLAMTGLNRIVAADWERGVLRAESGVLLADILACALPRGWFLPVVPGTRFVTLGGAIANDVHGKNHHRRGTFGCHVTALGLLRHGEEVVCSAEQEPELFAATVGGLGLSGVICWAELRLMPVRSDRIEVQTQRFDSLAEFFALSAEYDEQHEYAVAWVDCVARDKGVGRGVAFWGDHADGGERYAGGLSRQASWAVPFTPPVSLVNRWSVTAFNCAYWHRHPASRTRSEARIEPFSFRWTESGSGTGYTGERASSSFSAWCRRRMRRWPSARCWKRWGGRGRDPSWPY